MGFHFYESNLFSTKLQLLRLIFRFFGCLFPFLIKIGFLTIDVFISVLDKKQLINLLSSSNSAVLLKSRKSFCFPIFDLIADVAIACFVQFAVFFHL